MAGIAHQARVGQGSLLLGLGLTLVLFDVRAGGIDVLHDIVGGVLVMAGAMRLVAGIERAGWPGGMVVVTAGLMLATTIVAEVAGRAISTRVLTVASVLLFPSLALLLRESLHGSARRQLATLWGKNLVIVSLTVVPGAIAGLFLPTISSTATLIVTLAISVAALLGFLHTLLALVAVWTARSTLEQVAASEELVAA